MYHTSALPETHAAAAYKGDEPWPCFKIIKRNMHHILAYHKKWKGYIDTCVLPHCDGVR